MTDTDYYAVLGVSPDASTRQIAQAYRRQARAWHPDARPGDGEAAARFGEIAAAYHTLADPQLRADYDRARTGPPRQPRPARGRPVRVRHIKAGEGHRPAAPLIRPLPASWQVPGDPVEELLARLRKLLNGRW